MSSSETQPKLDIEVLPAASAADHQVVGEITDLINQVYAVAEAGLWVDGAARTTVDEVGEMIAAGQIAVAWLDGQLVGSIQIQQLDAATGEFAMLAGHPDHRSIGVGRELIRFAEEQARQRGSVIMHLELLVPREWTHPSKEFLHSWYTRIGYQPVRSRRATPTWHPCSPPPATSSCTTSR